MHKRFAVVAVLALAGLLAGCTSNSSSASPSGSTTAASSAPASSSVAPTPPTSTTAEASQSLGTIGALGKQIEVTAEGKVTAGQPATIAVKTGQKVDDVSGWLGKGVDKKVTCQLQTDEPQPDYDCMITIPNNVAAGEQIWIQITSNGKTESGGVNVPKTS
jgi:ABC-type Fe3+-hydroxamate transport system substrate-binding protein